MSDATDRIHALVSRYESSDRIPLSFDDWEEQVIGANELNEWVQFNIIGYLNYLLSYHRGEAKDQGAHGEPWFSDDEIVILRNIIAEAKEVIA